MTDCLFINHYVHTYAYINLQISLFKAVVVNEIVLIGPRIINNEYIIFFYKIYAYNLYYVNIFSQLNNSPKFMPYYLHTIFIQKYHYLRSFCVHQIRGISRRQDIYIYKTNTITVHK